MENKYHNEELVAEIKETVAKELDEQSRKGLANFMNAPFSRNDKETRERFRQYLLDAFCHHRTLNDNEQREVRVSFINPSSTGDFTMEGHVKLMEKRGTLQRVIQKISFKVNYERRDLLDHDAIAKRIKEMVLGARGSIGTDILLG